MNQNQIAELFDTSVPNISIHISNTLKEQEYNTPSITQKGRLTQTSNGLFFMESPTVVIGHGGFPIAHLKIPRLVVIFRLMANNLSLGHINNILGDIGGVVTDPL